jgi:RimJ/RimL family protein N-acetyltransferase
LNMKAGKTLRQFSSRGGLGVTLRTIRWEDLDDATELINSLVDERANITRNQKVTREEEIDWLSRALNRMERDEVVYVVGEVSGKMVANSEISRKINGYDSRVGMIGIAVKNGFRDMGIGTEMMKALVEQGRTWGLKVLTLTAFADNERAIHVYKKLGFTETGRIPQKFFKDGKYIDEILMTIVLE